MKVCFTGDLFLGGDLLNKNTELKISSRLFNDADKRVVNLEQPISNSEFIEDKCTLFTSSKSLKHLLEQKVSVVNIAHNHIHDKGLNGIVETREHLSEVGIGFFGAGANILEAEEPFWLSSDVALFGYCDFDKTYLNNVAVATSIKPGVNPLRLEKIFADLSLLPSGKKAIIYLHWGMEHVWLPPHHDLVLMKELLQHSSVLTVIGMHPHRIQGKVEHNGKVGFMCLGNFLFPNFHIKPPVQIFEPVNIDEIKYVTRRYHHVYKPTYKKWRWVNRVSLNIAVNLNTNAIEIEFVKQKDDIPQVCTATGIDKFVALLIYTFLSKIYKAPKSIYNIFFKTNVFFMQAKWKLGIAFFHYKQLGLLSFSGRLLSLLSSRLKKK